MTPGARRSIARDHLYAGQSNDCYWHGLFGGIYLPDLRVAALSRLIAAEDLAIGDEATPANLRDIDLDGHDEIVLTGRGQFVAIKLEEGGAIARWDLRAAAHPLAAVMRRRPEAYHETLRQHELAKAGGVRHEDAAAPDRDGSAPASIHDIVRVKQEGLLDHLRYDAYERRSGLLRIFAPGTSPEDALAGTAEELGDLRDGRWALAGIDDRRLVAKRDGTIRTSGGPVPIAATRTITIGGDRLDPTLELSLEIVHRGGPDTARIDALATIEWSTMLLGGGHNPAAWIELDGERTAHDLTRRSVDTTRFAVGNDQLGIVVETTTDQPVDAWIGPIETVSNSEAGFELVYQGSSTLFVRPLHLAPGERWSLRIRHAVRVSGERFVPIATDGADAGSDADRPNRKAVAMPSPVVSEVEAGRR
jgi:alpha-amylase